METNKKNPSLEEACQMYKLTKEENQKIGKIINSTMLSGKKAVELPIAIIDIAPPGSGKTGLNSMGVKQFDEGNVVVINSDELKLFHPKIDEIGNLYPQYYTKITNQESNAWTDNLFEEAVSKRYNIIFEGTGRNLKLLKKMIDMMSNYKVIVRGMAVDEVNCLISIIERYEEQVEEKGWGRLVTAEHFYKAYNEILDTIANIERMNIVDSIEIYTRGECPSEPKMIYSTKNKTYSCAKEAVIMERMKDRKKNIKYYNNNFNIKCVTEEEKEIIDRILSIGEKSKDMIIY